jgi:hypothetical protein
MTTKITLAVAGTALLLCAADAWKNPDYTQWSSEDAQKVMTKSPWAKETTVTMGQGSSPGSQGSRRGGMGGGGGMGGMGGGGMGGGRGGGMGGGGGQSAPSQKITIRWESAMPIKEAELKAQYGSQLPAKGDAGYTLDQPQTTYAISVTGLRLGGRRRQADSSDQSSSDGQKSQADRIKDQLMGATQLLRKGKDPLYPQDVQVNTSTNVVVFLFPKTDAISDDDKEVEFVTSMGPVQVKQKFTLKDMHFNGKLEL